MAWSRAGILALILLVLPLGGWEAYWRGQQFRPSTRNSDGLWAMARRWVDRAAPEQTVLIGSSRVLFDIDLDAWEEETGLLPLQLALEGTNPRPVLSDLAADPDFTGLAVVVVTPMLVVMPDAGLERVFAFYNFDTALFTVLHRQTWWPERPGLPFQPRVVRKLSDMDRRREADMWVRLEDDPEYAELAKSIWRDFLDYPPPAPSEAEARAQFEAMLDEIKRDVEAIRARGGDVAFVRLPSAGYFREDEAAAFPRERVWEPIVAAAGAVSVHFEDYPELMDVRLPEWSHVSARDKGRFTRDLVRILRDNFRARGTLRPELEP
ncbi:MAG: hypothetical protein P8Y15_13760 [Gemmatimonadales bacterium]